MPRKKRFQLSRPRKRRRGGCPAHESVTTTQETGEDLSPGDDSAVTTTQAAGEDLSPDNDSKCSAESYEYTHEDYDMEDPTVRKASPYIENFTNSFVFELPALDEDYDEAEDADFFPREYDSDGNKLDVDEEGIPIEPDVDLFEDEDMGGLVRADVHAKHPDAVPVEPTDVPKITEDIVAKGAGVPPEHFHMIFCLAMTGKQPSYHFMARSTAFIRALVRDLSQAANGEHAVLESELLLSKEYLMTKTFENHMPGHRFKHNNEKWLAAMDVNSNFLPRVYKSLTAIIHYLNSPAMASHFDCIKNSKEMFQLPENSSPEDARRRGYSTIRCRITGYVLHIHAMTSMKTTLGRYITHQYLGYYLIDRIYYHLLTRKKHYNSAHSYILYLKLFCGFAGRRAYLESLFRLYAVLGSDEAIKKHRTWLKKNLEDPGGFDSAVADEYGKLNKPNFGQLPAHELLWKRKSRQRMGPNTRMALHAKIISSEIEKLDKRRGYNRHVPKHKRLVEQVIEWQESIDTSPFPRHSPNQAQIAAQPAPAIVRASTVAADEISDIPDTSRLSMSHTMRLPPRFLDDEGNSTIRWACNDDLQRYDIKFIIDRAVPLVVVMTACEFYIHRDLRWDYHGVSVLPKDQIPMQQRAIHTTIPAEQYHRIDPKDKQHVVVREKSPFWTNHFKDLPIPIAAIATDLVKFGYQDPSRDVGGSRIDFGSDASGNFCGKETLQKFSEESRIGIGIALDAMFACSDDIHINQFKGSPQFPSRAETAKFVQPIREILKAKRIRGHWYTIILKRVSGLEGVKMHQDRGNSSHPSYNATHGLSYFFEDENEDLWRLAFVVNSRASIADQYKSGRTQLMKDCMKYERDINDDLEAKDVGCTARTMENLVLHDGLAWEPASIVEGTNGQTFAFPKCLKLLTTMFRDFWLSAMVHCIVQICEAVPLTKAQKVQLALIACYQNSCQLFWIIMTSVACEEWHNSDSPFLLYSRKSHECFGKFTGGKDPRYSACKNLGRYFLERENGKGEIDKFTELLIEFLQEIEDEGDPDTRVPMHAWQRRNVDFIERYKKSPGLEGVDFQIREFRLQIFIQICVLAKIVLGGGKKYKDLGYPAEGRASHDHLIQVGLSNQSQIQSYMNDLREDMDWPVDCGNNVVEAMLCESAPWRKCERYDYFPYGVTVYMLNHNGHSVRKPFEATQWQEWSLNRSELAG